MSKYFKASDVYIESLYLSYLWYILNLTQFIQGLFLHFEQLITKADFYGGISNKLVYIRTGNPNMAK